jgi:hypothetical protein
MMRRLELGPALAVLGALVLVASLFVEWFEPGGTAWEIYEWLDMLLAVLAIAAVLAAVGLMTPGRAVVDGDRLPLIAAAVLAIVAVQLLNPPPAVATADPAAGAWLALGAGFLIGAGAVLAFSRISLALSFEGRDPRRRVSAVDAREGAAPAAAPAAVAAEPTQPLGDEPAPPESGHA